MSAKQVSRRPFIVLEGSDGAGKSTQFEKLKQHLSSAGYQTDIFKFPRYGQPSASLVELYLNGKLGEAVDSGPFAGSTYYAIDRFHGGKTIRASLEKGYVAICDRYVGSNMAHQGQQIASLEERQKYYDWVRTLEFSTYGIPYPDINIVLVMPAEIARTLADKREKRDYTDKKRDLLEDDFEHLQRSVQVYEELCELYPDDFVKIDCAPNYKLLSIDEIHDKIWTLVLPLLRAKQLPVKTLKLKPDTQQIEARGVFSNKDIRAAIQSGHIVCRPFNPKHISHASLDVTLGSNYYRTEHIGNKTVYNPFDEKDVNRYFDGPYQAVSHKEWCDNNGLQPLKGIPYDHPVIPLAPGERILAHTHEFFGIKPPGAYEIKSRSSWGRNGIAVCFDAGWVDPGYINRLTLEIYNLNSKETVLLPVGERIAQAVFVHTGEVEGNYGLGRDDGMSGKYQTGTDLEELIRNWHPSQMLPKSFMDVRQLPREIDGLRIAEPSISDSASNTTNAALASQPKSVRNILTNQRNEEPTSPTAAQVILIEKDKNGAYAITQAGKDYLRDAVTDVEGNVYAFTHKKLSSATAAAAMARLSRRGDDMRITLLDEFANKPEKDEDLLRRVITAYGDDSVQQLAGLHVVVEGASNILTKKLEWGRLAAYLEQSTRYIYFDETDKSGRYKFYTPPTLDAAAQKAYNDTLTMIFRLYSDVVHRLSDYLKKTSTTPENERDIAWKGAVRAQACDAARPMLPVATKSTVGIFASGQAMENLIMHLLSDPFEEAKSVGQQLLSEVRKVAPVFFERADKPERGGATIAYRANTDVSIKTLAESKLTNKLPPAVVKPVQLTDYWPKNEFDLLPHMLYPHSHLSLEDLEHEVSQWSYDEKVKAFRAYMGERLNRRHKPGRALEIAHYSWDIVCDYGIFRDLQRHRMVDSLEWQELTPRYGYEVPKLVEKAGLAELFVQSFDLSYKLYSALQEAGYHLEAQYATLLGHRMRWKLTYNARQAFHLHELRTTPQGHPGYRKLVKQIHDILASVHPLIAESIKFVNKDEDPELTRLAAERYTQYKLKQLQKNDGR